MNQKGSVLVLSIFVLAMILLLAGLFLQLTVINLMLLERSLGVDKAYWITIAGINQQKHDMKDYWFQHQMEYVGPKEFGGGQYKVGVATLIGQGIHRAFIVSLGEWPISAKEEERHRKCIYAQVSMNTPTDYLFFFEGKAHNFRSHNSGGNPIHAGPIHLNGDAYVGHGPSFVFDGSANSIFKKSDKDYGPVISCSGTIYSANDSYSGGVNLYTAFGEGEILNPFTFNCSNIPSNFTDVTYSSYGGIKWPGNGGASRGQPEPVPYNSKAFPSLTKPKIGLDGNEYSYPLVEHKENGGIYIKVPKTTEISEKYFKKWINPDWYIENFDWSNGCASTTYITDEQRPRSSYATIPEYDKEMNPGGIEFGKERDPRFIRHISLRPSSNTNTYVWPLSQYWMFNRYINARVPLEFDSPLTGYYIDINNNKAVFNYNASFGEVDSHGDSFQGLEWDGFYFKSPPLGTWKGRRVNWLIGVGNGVADQTFTIYSTYGGGGTIHRQSLSKYSAVNETGSDAEKIYVGCNDNGSGGILWERAPGGELSNLPNGDGGTKYGIDFNEGIVKFGNYDSITNTSGKGAIPPAGAQIRATWSHVFNTPIEVWLHKMYQVVKIDLDKIDENNCPKDPNYPDDETKFGVIYSKVPLHIMGTPKVPVTIVCEDDVWVGPINSRDRLNEKLEPKGLVDNDYADDSEEICPVGIICKGSKDATTGKYKGIITLDMSYAPHRKAPPDLGPKYDTNTFIPWDNGKASEGDYNKTLKLNKVVLYDSYFFDITQNYLDWDSKSRGIEGNYERKLGMHMGGGVGYGENDSHYGRLSTDPGVYARFNDIRFVGSKYSCDNLDLAKDTSTDDIYWGQKYDYVYGSSFRYWDKDKPLTSGPPQHIPMDIRMESWGAGNIEAGNKYFVELKRILDANLGYTPEFSEVINELLTTIEK
ncbi:MAG: hypothetical protein ABH873_06525 [Candidatus Firestonebacteria bacterium]